jgi:transcriptional regulator with XRE-family HTH domain
VALYALQSTVAIKNALLDAPPFPIEQAVKRLGADLRTARLNRNLSVAEVAAKIGTGPRAVMDAEKGKVSSVVAVYMALLWTYGFLDQLAEVADPARDEEGKALASAGQRQRARSSDDLDNDF